VSDQDDWVSVTGSEPQPKKYHYAHPEAKVLAAAVSGNPAAIQALLGYLRPLVLRYCLSRLSGRSRGNVGTDDCAQDILLAVLSALPSYRLPPDRFLPFVFGIARHKVIDAYRGQARDRTDSAADVGGRDQGGRDPGYAEIEGRLSLSALLATLPPLHQEILAMRVILGYSAEETAAALNMPSAGAVRVTQHRALAALRRRMVADPHRRDDG
jgi:RNA polymerase sigma-70 factor (ECF subfamily)